MIRPNSPGSASSCAAAIALVLASTGCHRATPAERNAVPIAEKNAAARGGLEAWRAVKSMSLSGTLDAGKPKDPIKLSLAYTRTSNELKADARKAVLHGREAEVEKPLQLPFVMELKRPAKTRLQIRFQGETAVQVFDGTSGWKLRPFLGRREIEPYSAEEMLLASQQTDLDGPLIDFAAKGNKLALVGTEPVEGRDAYKLKLTMSNGQVRNVWVDAQTFLEVKIDGSRQLDGKPRPVWTFFREYKQVGGLMIPHLLETTAEGVKGSQKIIIEQVALNPIIDDSRFAQPD